MNTFASRLKFALFKRGLSQAEAAKLCGISQQSINYIITRDLKTSKLALQIASGLDINSEWLIYGKGKLENTELYEVPVLHSINMLQSYLNNNLIEQTNSVFIDKNLGELSFAYLFEPNKLAICTNHDFIINDPKFTDYLIIKDNKALIQEFLLEDDIEYSFLIYEWRTRSVNF